MIKDILHSVFIIVQIFALFYGFYYFSISIYGILERLNKKPIRNYLPLKKFAIFIPAHNEEKVIENIVDNLKYLNYLRIAMMYCHSRQLQR